MPVYDKGYRSFDGEVRRQFRWWTIVQQEWRIIRKRRIYWVLMIPPIFLSLLFAAYIYFIDIIGTNQNHPWAEAVNEFPLARVDNNLFFTFITYQSSFVFILTILSGAGLIANDFRYNLVDIYFSKPLSWLDYVLGKVMTLVLIGLGITLLPSLIFMLLHILFAPSWQTIKEMSLLVAPTAGFSLCIAMPSALAVLASSAFFNSPRFASITVFMLLMVNSGFGLILPELLRERSLHVIAFPVAVTRIGEAIFQRANLQTADVSINWSITFWVTVCLVAALIVCRKVRRAGAAA